MKKILVIGAGSIGTLIGASLVKAGFEVTFVGRTQSSYTEHIKHFGLTLVYPSGEKYKITPDNPKVRFFDTAEKLAETFEIIFVAVKSNRLASVASYIRNHSDKNSSIFHAQNGIPYWWFANDDYVASLTPKLKDKIGFRRYLNSVDPDGKILTLLGDRCLLGCVLKAPCGKNSWGEIEVRKPPKMLFGFVGNKKDVFPRADVARLCQLLSEGGLITTYTEKIRVEVCHKLAINLATNVLSALTGCTIAKLTMNFYTNSIIRTILAEIRDIFLVYGIEKADLPSEAKVYAYITQPGSQRHLPSLAQDFALRRLGEVNLITAPVEMAEIARIKTPTITSLAKLLQVGQTHALDNSDGNFNILTFDRDFGYCLLNDSVYHSRILDRKSISELVNYLIQINLTVVEQNVA